MSVKQTRFGKPKKGYKSRKKTQKDKKPLSEIDNPEKRKLERLKRNVVSIT